jgi:hypothetical protein
MRQSNQPLGQPRFRSAGTARRLALRPNHPSDRRREFKYLSSDGKPSDTDHTPKRTRIAVPPWHHDSLSETPAPKSQACRIGRSTLILRLRGAAVNRMMNQQGSSCYAVVRGLDSNGRHASEQKAPVKAGGATFSWRFTSLDAGSCWMPSGPGWSMTLTPMRGSCRPTASLTTRSQTRRPSFSQPTGSGGKSKRPPIFPASTCRSCQWRPAGRSARCAGRRIAPSGRR